VALILGLSFNACDLNRVDTPPLSITESDFFTSESEFEQVLYLAYSKITGWYEFDSYNYMHPMFLLRDDQLTEDNGAEQQWEIFNNINVQNGFANKFWRLTYQMIQTANVIVEKVDAANLDEFDEGFLNRVKGEALFLRSLANYHLFNQYKIAPVITERITTADAVHSPPSTGTELLDQAISDLNEAVELLPVSYAEAQRGRATKNSANGLLLKCLVIRGDYSGNQSDYSQAVTVFRKITASLEPNYGHNFSAFHENNNESIFEHQASANTGADDNIWLQNDGPWRGTEPMTAYWAFFNEGDNWGTRRGGAHYKVTQKMWNAYSTDPRINFFANTTNRNFLKYGKEGFDAHPDFPPIGSTNNPRILRYSESILLAAEALLLSGGSKPEAIGLINDVRERARNWAIAEGLEDVTLPADRSTAESNDATIMSWIEEERNIELFGELDIRWYDLKRWDARGYKNLANWGGGIEHFSTDLQGEFQFEYPKHLLLPIPQDEIDRNFNFIQNNPGY
jgi:tetratricopeptide (TPR) repeat protein